MPKNSDFEECHKIFNEDNEGFDGNFVLHYYLEKYLHMRAGRTLYSTDK